MKKILLAFIISFSTSFGYAQISESSELFQILKANDSLLFDVGFNTCDMKTWASLITDDLEFYHDKGGVTSSKAQLLEEVNNGICKSDDFVSRRALIKGSLKVFPMYNEGTLYGAIQEGIHRFYEKPKGRTEVEGSIARFTHLWLLQQDGSWKISLVLSYDHIAKVPKMTKKKAVKLSHATLTSYAGKYKAPQTGEVTFTVLGNGLKMEAGTMKLTLLHESEGKFYNEQTPLTFEFQIDAAGKAIACIIRENGKIVEEAKKISE